MEAVVPLEMCVWQADAVLWDILLVQMVRSGYTRAFPGLMLACKGHSVVFLGHSAAPEDAALEYVVALSAAQLHVVNVVVS
jgi:hypothetical protein